MGPWITTNLSVMIVWREGQLLRLFLQYFPFEGQTNPPHVAMALCTSWVIQHRGWSIKTKNHNVFMSVLCGRVQRNVNFFHFPVLTVLLAQTC